MEPVKEALQIYSNFGYRTQIIAASIRHPLHVVQAAKADHVATIPFKVLEQMFRHPLTDAGLKKFLNNWRKKWQKIVQSSGFKAVLRNRINTQEGTDRVCFLQ